MRAIPVAVAAAGLVAAFHAVPVSASAFSLDQSDLWWNPAESGWGIQLVQRGPLIFATMFVYAANGGPTWYVALLSPPPGASAERAAPALYWSGELDATTGTGFAATWSPMAFNVTKVGTMTWTPSNATSGTLVYSVNGVAVNKSIVREFITYDDFSGTYMGAIHDSMAGCSDASKNVVFDDFANVTITQTGQSLGLTLATTTTGISCTFQGTLTQAGRFGAATGTFNCNGKATPGNLFNVVVGPDSIIAHFSDTNSSNGCMSSGYLAGARHM